MAGYVFLWLTRHQALEAVVPSSVAACYTMQLTTRPDITLGGREDALVKFEWQEMMTDAARKVNGCDSTSQPWQGSVCTLYPSKGRPPLVAFIYPVGHAMDSGEPALIVKFFQEPTGGTAVARP